MDHGGFPPGTTFRVCWLRDGRDRGIARIGEAAGHRCREHGGDLDRALRELARTPESWGIARSGDGQATVFQPGGLRRAVERLAAAAG